MSILTVFYLAQNKHIWCLEYPFGMASLDNLSKTFSGPVSVSPDA